METPMMWDAIALIHDDVMKWKHFPCYWLLLCGEFTGHRWIPLTKASDGALMFALICTWLKAWVNNHEAVWRHCDENIVDRNLDKNHVSNAMHSSCILTWICDWTTFMMQRNIRFTEHQIYTDVYTFEMKVFSWWIPTHFMTFSCHVHSRKI